MPLIGASIGQDPHRILVFLLFGSVSVGIVVIGLGVVIRLAGAIVLLGIRVSPGVVVIGASVGIFANFWCSLALVLFLLSLVSALVLALVLVLALASIKSLIRPRNESVMQKSKNLDRNQFQLFCGDKKNISRK